MTKIPPGVYSEHNGKLVAYVNNQYGLLEYSDSNAPIIATINYKIEGIPQLEVRERSAEEVLSKHIKAFQSSGKRVTTAADLKKMYIDAMVEYRSQPIAPVSEEEIERMATQYADEEGSCWPNDFNGFMAGAKAIIARTQSGYTREQMEEAIDMARETEEIIGSGGQLEYAYNNSDDIIQALKPSITSVTIGEENNIIDIKYK